MQAQEETRDLSQQRNRWANFYERTVKPTAAVPYREEIARQQTWTKAELLEAKPFNFNIADRPIAQQASTIQQNSSYACSSDGLRSMVFTTTKLHQTMTKHE